MTADQLIHVLLAVSNNVISEGLRKVLQESRHPTNVLVLEEAPSSFSPDLIIFDINQPIQPLYSRYPRAKAVLLDSGIDDREINYLLMCYQVRGIISPQDSVEMFYKALRVVHRGDIWIDQKHLKSLLVRAGAMTTAGDIKGLSAQDRKIIRMISHGAKNQEIADDLCLSEHTIKSHVSRIYKKLNVKNRVQLVSLARDSRLCDVEVPDRSS